MTTEMRLDGRAVINGERVAARSGQSFDCISPVDGRILTQVARSSEADIDAAVSAARAAFEDRRWSGLAPAQRKRIMIKFADLLLAHADELAMTETLDMGKPVKIIDLARKMIKLAGFTPEKDIKIAIVGLRPGEKLYEELLNNTSKTLPTYHEKIMIAEEILDDFETLNVAINGLIASANCFNNDEMVAKMKQIVPEFKSMNSTFELLDK